MSIAEALMVIAAWCGMSTYSRADAKQVNACREQMLECAVTEVKMHSINKTVKLFGEQTKLIECAKKQKLVD